MERSGGTCLKLVGILAELLVHERTDTLEVFEVFESVAAEKPDFRWAVGLDAWR